MSQLPPPLLPPPPPIPPPPAFELLPSQSLPPARNHLSPSPSPRPRSLPPPPPALPPAARPTQRARKRGCLCHLRPVLSPGGTVTGALTLEGVLIPNLFANTAGGAAGGSEWDGQRRGRRSRETVRNGRTTTSAALVHHQAGERQAGYLC